MPPVPVLRPREVIRGFKAFGWEEKRQTGSHIILAKAGHPATLSVPNHATVAKGTLQGLLSSAEIRLEDFMHRLKC